MIQPISKTMKITLTLLLPLLIISCSKSTNTPPVGYSIDSLKTISINLDDSNPIRMSEFFSHIEYHYLESPPNRPIARIWKILVNDNYIALLDRVRPSVWLYTRGGEFINEIHIPYGRGPGELEEVIDFTFVKDSLLSVLGYYKLVTYNISGKLISEVNFKFVIHSFTYSEENELYIGNATNNLNRPFLNSMMKGHNLYFFDHSGNIQYYTLPISKGKEHMAFIIPNAFPSYKKSRYYIPHLVDTIFVLQQRRISAAYAIDYGEYSIPQDVFSRRNNYDKEWYNWTEFKEKEIDNKGYAYGISVFAESDSYIYLSFQAKNKPHQAIYNKTSGAVRASPRPMINDIDLGLSAFLYEGHQNALYTVIEPNDLLRHLNEIYENEPDKYMSEKMAPLRKIAHSIDENTNPILMISYYKN